MKAIPPPVIVAREITKRYGDLVAVDRLSFSVRPGTCLGLLGPNGAGKTTMMKMIYGKALRDPSSGDLAVFGHDPQTGALRVKALSGIVPQEDSLDAELDVHTNLRLYARFYGMPKAAAGRRIAELLAFMELGDKEKSRIRELSGGMKRRLVIARALLNNPRLLILDEPTTGLDPQVRHLIWDRLRTLRSAGTTILLTTHYMDEAYQLCDNLIIMDRGRSVLEGHPRELVENNIEKFALQVFDRDAWSGSGAKKTATGKTRAGRGAVRLEEAGGMLYAYADTMAPLEKMAATMTARDYIIRQTNLEDLFLKATGKGLGDDQ